MFWGVNAGVFKVCLRAKGCASVQSLSSSVGTMQQVLEEASRLLHLVWRVSLPTGGHTAGEHGSNQQVSVPSRRSRFTLGSDFRLMLPRPLLLWTNALRTALSRHRCLGDYSTNTSVLKAAH